MVTDQDSKPDRWTRVREIAPYAAIYVFLGFLALRLKLLVTPAWFDGTLDNNHKALLAFEYTNNEQSRILQFYIPELLVRAFGMTVSHAYIVQRWLFVALSYLLFQLYLRRWFPRTLCFGAVCLLAAILPFSFINDLQESSPFLMVSFVASLWVLRDGPSWAFAIALLIGAMNNETSLSLLVVYLAAGFTRWSLGALVRLAGQTLAVSAPAILYTVWIRWLTRDRPHLGGARHWRDNLRGMRHDLHLNPLDYVHADYLFVFFIFNLFWIYAYLKISDKPRFVRATLWLVPPFVLAHLVTGITSEVRQMIPLAFVVLPAGLCWLFPQRGPDREAIG
jgi:hypothetical protein